MLTHHHITNPKAEDLQFDHRVSNKVYVGYIKTVYLVSLGQLLIKLFESLTAKSEMVLDRYRHTVKAICPLSSNTKDQCQ